MCDGLGRQFSYTCPNTTLFQQRMLICDHWYMVNCSKAESDYDANLLIGTGVFSMILGFLYGDEFFELKMCWFLDFPFFLEIYEFLTPEFGEKNYIWQKVYDFEDKQSSKTMNNWKILEQCSSLQNSFVFLCLFVFFCSEKSKITKLAKKFIHFQKSAKISSEWK